MIANNSMELKTTQGEQEEAVDPFDPFQPGEEQNVYSCPACRGRHRGHTRDERCRLAVIDLDEETIADIDDGELSYERLPDELKEAGAIPVSLKDVRNSIGRDREEWRIAIDAELNSLKETNSIYSVTEIPEGATVLPMKLVATLKFKDRSPLRKKKARTCVCGNFQRRGTTRYVLHSEHRGTKYTFGTT